MQQPEWDSWVAQFAGHGVFHSSPWLHVLADTYRFRPGGMGLWAGQRPTAVAPFVEIETVFGRRRGVSLPFSDLCPLLAGDPVQAEQLFREVLQHGRERGWRSYECRGGVFPAATLAKPLISYHRHRLDLRPGPERLFAGFDGSVRRAIRKAERAGVRVETQNSLEALRRFYRLHCVTRRKHGAPPQPLAFFENIQRRLLAAGLGCVVLARHQDRLVAGAVFLQFQQQAVYKFGASDPRWQDLRANNLVFWTAIESYARAGFASLDFGRTDPGQEGLRRFKAGWGSEESSIDYFRYDLRKDAFASESVRRPWRLKWLFRMMPASVARMAGALLYRQAA